MPWLNPVLISYSEGRSQLEGISYIDLKKSTRCKAFPVCGQSPNWEFLTQFCCRNDSSAGPLRAIAIQ